MTAGAAKLLLAALAACALAQGEPGSVELKGPGAQVPIGLTFEIDGVARFAERYRLSFDPSGQDTGAVTLVEARAGAERTAGGLREQALTLKVAAFELGVVSLPPLSFTLTAPDGSTRALKSPELRWESVGPKPDPAKPDEIRDIRGPLAAPWWLSLAAAAAALPLAALAWLWWRRRKGGAAAAAAAVDHRLPHERALDELRALYQAQLPVKEFYSRMTEVLRRYFEGRWGVSAAVLTTSDLLRQLRRAELDTQVLSRCRGVFERGDLVKFAKVVPDTAEIRKDWESAVWIVETTAPPPPAPPEGEAPAAKPSARR